ncbi:MAG: hypothetical protein ABFC63_08075 [Thermoguttaceae bacterium]
MRWTPWTVAAAIVVGLAATAAQGQPDCVGCNGRTAGGLHGQWALGCEACCAPPGYFLAPGCCEPYRRCCDNSWAGYCEHRARVEAFWARAGVPGRRCASRGCIGSQPSDCADNGVTRSVPRPVTAPKPRPALRSEPQPAIRPLPPVEPAPPAPEAPSAPGKTTYSGGPALR